MPASTAHRGLTHRWLCRALSPLVDRALLRVDVPAGERDCERLFSLSGANLVLPRLYQVLRESGLLARFPRETADWLVAPHLGHTNRAPFRQDHPDHGFAKDLTGCFFASLPKMDRPALVAMLTARMSEDELARKPDAAMRQAVIDRLFPASNEARAGLAELDAPTLRTFYERVVDSDAFRVMTGRLAMSWDGGQILDD